jgi:TRAP-type mannitol/chloroaromatic compound transport system permease large subunit
MIEAIANLQPEYIGIIMIAVMLFAIFIGFPISFRLIFLGMVFGLWGFGELLFYLMTLQFSSVMLEQTLAAGTITAGGTLGILIPPSIILVVMGPILEVPVTDLFAAAIIPGFMLASLYIGYALLRCQLNPELGPRYPKSCSPNPWAKWQKSLHLDWYRPLPWWFLPWAVFCSAGRPRPRLQVWVHSAHSC